MESLVNSFKIIKQLIAFLFRNTDLLLLTTFFLSIIIGFLFLVKNIIISIDSFGQIILLSVSTYLICCFLITFYEAILISIITKRLNSKNRSVLVGMYCSWRYLFPVFIWSLILSTLGLVDKIMRYALPGRIMMDFFTQRYYSTDRSLLLPYFTRKSWFFSWFLFNFSYFLFFRFSWNFSTYFVLPFLVTEDISLTSAVNQSKSLFGPGWRKNFRISPLIGTCCLITLIIWLYISHTFLPVSTGVLFIPIILVCYVVVAVTLNAIEKSALYTSYVLHQHSNDFDQELLNTAYSKMHYTDDLFSR